MGTEHGTRRHGESEFVDGLLSEMGMTKTASKTAAEGDYSVEEAKGVLDRFKSDNAAVNSLVDEYKGKLEGADEATKDDVLTAFFSELRTHKSFNVSDLRYGRQLGVFERVPHRANLYRNVKSHEVWNLGSDGSATLQS